MFLFHVHPLPGRLKSYAADKCLKNRGQASTVISLFCACPRARWSAYLPTSVYVPVHVLQGESMLEAEEDGDYSHGKNDENLTPNVKIERAIVA